MSPLPSTKVDEKIACPPLRALPCWHLRNLDALHLHPVFDVPSLGEIVAFDACFLLARDVRSWSYARHEFARALRVEPHTLDVAECEDVASLPMRTPQDGASLYLVRFVPGQDPRACAVQLDGSGNAMVEADSNRVVKFLRRERLRS